MKYTVAKNLVKYFYENFISNFLGFMVGMASSRLVSHFFATRSIRNLWGLTSRKTVINKTTFNNLEWIISVVIGFIVFEIISKWVKKRTDELYLKYKAVVLRKLGRQPANATEGAEARA